MNTMQTITITEDGNANNTQKENMQQLKWAKQKTAQTEDSIEYKQLQ